MNRPKEPQIKIEILKKDDDYILENVAVDVFDFEIRTDLVRKYLKDPRHHIVVAIEGDTVVGFASGFHYIHPDKPAALFINEVGVAPTHQRQGIGTKLLKELLSLGKELGCYEAWVGTELDNLPARGLYKSVGGIQDSNQFVSYVFPLNSD